MSAAIPASSSSRSTCARQHLMLAHTRSHAALVRRPRARMLARLSALSTSLVPKCPTSQTYSPTSHIHMLPPSMPLPHLIKKALDDDGGLVSGDGPGALLVEELKDLPHRGLLTHRELSPVGPKGATPRAHRTTKNRGPAKRAPPPAVRANSATPTAGRRREAGAPRQARREARPRGPDPARGGGSEPSHSTACLAATVAATRRATRNGPSSASPSHGAASK